jgi:predicted nucleic acid-binding protein
MLLIDTSVWINVFRDRSGQVRQKLETLLNGREVLITRFTQLELLQGSQNEKEWTLDHDLLLIHNDRDFETIAQARSLRHFRFS